MTGNGKSAALDGGKPLADGVDFHNVRAAGEQLVRHILQHRPGNQRFFKQGAAAAGQQKQHGVLRLQSGNQIQRFLCAGKRILIRDGMSRLPAGKIGNGAFYMAVFGNNHAAVNAAAQTIVGRFCHLPGGLTRGNQYNPPGETLSRQGAGDGLIRLNGFDGGGHDGVRMSP